MIANPDKFHSKALTKNKAENLNLEVKIGDQMIKCEQYVQLLRVTTIENELNFGKHMSDLWELNKYIIQFNNILPIKVKFVLLSLVYADYCPLIWHFHLLNLFLKWKKF